MLNIQHILGKQFDPAADILIFYSEDDKKILKRLKRVSNQLQPVPLILVPHFEAIVAQLFKDTVPQGSLQMAWEAGTEGLTMRWQKAPDPTLTLIDAIQQFLERISNDNALKLALGYNVTKLQLPWHTVIQERLH